MARVLSVNALPQKRDLVEHFVFLADHVGVDTGRRFRQAVRTTLHQLSQMPEMGSHGIFRNPRFESIRMWRVRGFDRYLIFYRPFRDGIEVHRIIHGARNIEELFR